MHNQVPSYKTLSKQRSFPTMSSISYYPKLSLYFLAASVTLLLLLEIQLLKNPLPFLLSSQSLWTVAAFVPLKNQSLADTAMEGNTWFMSALNDTYEPGETQYLLFPSNSSDGRLLCVTGNHTRDGTRNAYALVSPGSLPRGAKLYAGLTFLSDTQYDYENLWHGLAAVAPYVAWHERKGCVRPERWVLYHWGEIRSRMGPWVGSVVESVFGRKAEIETFEDRGGSDMPNCFEEALVFRHNEGLMSRDRKEEMYGLIRCKARAYCNITSSGSGREGDRNIVRLTLLLRVGARSFRDDDAVISVFDRECRKVDGCRLTVARPNNLTFCNQVKLMSSTDILASPHGAQLTNMFLMDRNSSVMEFFPSGWLKLAGPGQYVYHWIAGSSGMRHKGAWRDPDNSKKCPYDTDAECFLFYKDGQLGHDEAYFSNWTARVIREARDYKLSAESEEEISCSCTS